MEIIGTVVSGTGEGSYFMSLEIYKEKFREKLGFEPFPGTLNLKISEEDTKSINDLEDAMGIIKGSKGFGDVKFLRAQLNGEIDGAILFPVKTQHSSKTLEFVAREKLRKKLKLEDGDVATLKIE
ncbi:MAG: Riboflavin kinase [Methanobacterium sp. PtaB.Bin024]|jgi:riboflavin kinase|nr:MAG: Riboflavin kinase [Methanobacterium sp. PtaB.Bin024]